MLELMNYDNAGERLLEEQKTFRIDDRKPSGYLVKHPGPVSIKHGQRQECGVWQ